MDNPRLQPLRIPGGWRVDFNCFEDIDPEPGWCPKSLSVDDDKQWLWASEDLLQLCAESSRKQNHRTETQTLVIDLGWYPEFDPTGSFTLCAVLNGNWAEPLFKFTSRSKTEIVNTLEYWLFREFMPSNRFIDEEYFRKNHKYE